MHTGLAHQTLAVQAVVDVVHEHTTTDLASCGFSVASSQIASSHELGGNGVIDPLEGNGTFSRVHDHRDPGKGASGSGSVLSEERIGRGAEVAMNGSVSGFNLTDERIDFLIIGSSSRMDLFQPHHASKVIGVEISKHGVLHVVGNIVLADVHILTIPLEVLVV